MTVPSVVARNVPIAFGVFAVWFAFNVLQFGVAAALARPGALHWERELPVDLTMTVYWSLATGIIALWHRLLRARHLGMLGLAAAHLPLLVVVTVGDMYSARVGLRLFAGITPPLPFIAALTYYADFDLISYVAVVAAVDALMAREALRVGERRAARLEGLLARARLDYLEAQLQPHFLFNALSAVSELAYEAPATAARVLKQLASIFRNAVSSRAGEVTLGEELTAVEPYLDIQRLRFSDWLRIEYDVAGDALDCLVPRFVLQPLVENAIRHGLTGRLAAGCIEISARRENGRLLLRVADNGVGVRRDIAPSGYGIGLANVRDRLITLYGTGEHLRLFDGPDGGAVAEVSLAVRHAAEMPAATIVQSAEETATASPNGSNKADRTLSWPSRAAIGVGIWLCCGLLWAMQSYTFLRMRNRLGSYTWLSIARIDIGNAMIWCCLAPILFIVARQAPLARSRFRWRSLAYFALIAVVAVAQVAIRTRLLTPKTLLWSSANTTSFITNFLIGVVLVAVAHHRRLLTWLRDRERAEAALSAELRAARARAARLQTIPPVVLRALDRVIVVVGADPSPRRTEQLLARLADYLRVAIECSDERGVTNEREQSLARCLARLERVAGTPLQPPTPTVS